MDLSSLSKRPLKLLINRVRRPFCGGYLLDQWQGSQNPADGYQPEEWVASMVEARNPGPIEGEGLSKLVLEDGSVMTLKDLIEKDPVSFLGKEHVDNYGSSPAILVKVLDSYTRLLIQVHPDKKKAEELFKSAFGKTEAWYIIGGRKVNGEDPYVFFGFKTGIAREKWQELYENQDIKGMENALHKIPVKQGDVFFVEGGVPHAAGSGIFFIEIQEPTDYTIRTEKKNLAGEPLTEMQLHQGLGFNKMFDCFHYDGYTLAEILNKWNLKPQEKEVQQGGKELYLISPKQTPYFSMTRLEVDGIFITNSKDRFSMCIILEGKGIISSAYGKIEVKAGDEVFIPALLNEYKWDSCAEPLTVICCHPPCGAQIRI